MSNYPAPVPVYLGPPARSSGTGNKPIHRIVIHETQSATREGAARAVAAWFRDPNARGSAHYCIDPGEVVQSAYDSVVCWHAPPNGNSLGLELCGVTTNSILRWLVPKAIKRRVQARRQRRREEGKHVRKINPLRWLNRDRRRMLERAADLTADLCLAYDVPPVYRSAKALRSGARGVTTHAQVSIAWGQSSHWDPGAWPRRRFMRRVRTLHREKLAAHTARQDRRKR